MKVSGLPELAADYSTAFEDYLAGAQESALVHAYEIGRRAIEAGFGVLDLVRIHERPWPRRWNTPRPRRSVAR